MTISETLAHFTATTGFDALSDKDVAGAREAISDCIACGIVGTRTELGTIIRRVATASSGTGAATIFGGAQGVSAQAAALANGAAAHALDYDDILWTLYGHPSVAVLPAALAVAESVGASGRELLLAYAIGVEVIGKLGRWVNPGHYEHGWHSTASVGVIGATAAASRLLGLTEPQIAQALGIAASEACGVRRNFGTMTKPFHAGNAARGGVLAAELAREGFTSDLTAFEGEVGWARTLNARSMPTPAELAAALGRPWELSEPGIVLKRHSACGCTHCALDAIIGLRAEHGFAPEEIEAIDCVAHPLAKKVLLYPRPRTGLEGKFSMEYCLAVGAIDGAAVQRHFEPGWVADPRVAALLPRVTFNVRDDLAATASADGVPAEVTVRARGQSFTRRVMFPSGDPRNPMTPAERRAKFLACSGGILDDAVAGRLWTELESLDRVAQVRTLLAPLRAAAATRDAVPA